MSRVPIIDRQWDRARYELARRLRSVEDGIDKDDLVALNKKIYDLTRPEFVKNIVGDDELDEVYQIHKFVLEKLQKAKSKVLESMRLKESAKLFFFEEAESFFDTTGSKEKENLVVQTSLNKVRERIKNIAAGISRLKNMKPIVKDSNTEVKYPETREEWRDLENEWNDLLNYFPKGDQAFNTYGNGIDGGLPKSLKWIKERTAYLRLLLAYTYYTSNGGDILSKLDTYFEEDPNRESNKWYATIKNLRNPKSLKAGTAPYLLTKEINYNNDDEFFNHYSALLSLDETIQINYNLMKQAFGDFERAKEQWELTHSTIELYERRVTELETEFNEVKSAYDNLSTSIANKTVSILAYADADRNKNKTEGKLDEVDKVINMYNAIEGLYQKIAGTLTEEERVEKHNDRDKFPLLYMYTNPYLSNDDPNEVTSSDHQNYSNVPEIIALLGSQDNPSYANYLRDPKDTESRLGKIINTYVDENSANHTGLDEIRNSIANIKNSVERRLNLGKELSKVQNLNHDITKSLIELLYDDSSDKQNAISPNKGLLTKLATDLMSNRGQNLLSSSSYKRISEKAEEILRYLEGLSAEMEKSEIYYQTINQGPDSLPIPATREDEIYNTISINIERLKEELKNFIDSDNKNKDNKNVLSYWRNSSTAILDEFREYIAPHLDKINRTKTSGEYSLGITSRYTDANSYRFSKHVDLDHDTDGNGVKVYTIKEGFGELALRLLDKNANEKLPSINGGTIDVPSDFMTIVGSQLKGLEKYSEWKDVIDNDPFIRSYISEYEKYGTAINAYRAAATTRDNSDKDYVRSFESRARDLSNTADRYIDTYPDISGTYDEALGRLNTRENEISEIIGQINDLLNGKKDVYYKNIARYKVAVDDITRDLRDLEDKKTDTILQKETLIWINENENIATYNSAIELNKGLEIALATGSAKYRSILNSAKELQDTVRYAKIAIKAIQQGTTNRLLGTETPQIRSNSKLKDFNANLVSKLTYLDDLEAKASGYIEENSRKLEAERKAWVEITDALDTVINSGRFGGNHAIINNSSSLNTSIDDFKKSTIYVNDTLPNQISVFDDKEYNEILPKLEELIERIHTEKTSSSPNSTYNILNVTSEKYIEYYSARDRYDAPWGAYYDMIVNPESKGKINDRNTSLFVKLNLLKDALEKRKHEDESRDADYREIYVSYSDLRKRLEAIKNMYRSENMLQQDYDVLSRKTESGRVYLDNYITRLNNLKNTLTEELAEAKREYKTFDKATELDPIDARFASYESAHQSDSSVTDLSIIKDSVHGLVNELNKLKDNGEEPDQLGDISKYYKRIIDSADTNINEARELLDSLNNDINHDLGEKNNNPDDVTREEYKGLDNDKKVYNGANMVKYLSDNLKELDNDVNSWVDTLSKSDLIESIVKTYEAQADIIGAMQLFEVAETGIKAKNFEVPVDIRLMIDGLKREKIKVDRGFNILLSKYFANEYKEAVDEYNNRVKSIVSNSQPVIDYSADDIRRMSFGQIDEARNILKAQYTPPIELKGMEDTSANARLREYMFDTTIINSSLVSDKDGQLPNDINFSRSTIFNILENDHIDMQDYHSAARAVKGNYKNHKAELESRKRQIESKLRELNAAYEDKKRRDLEAWKEWDERIRHATDNTHDAMHPNASEPSEVQGGEQ